MTTMEDEIHPGVWEEVEVNPSPKAIEQARLEKELVERKQQEINETVVRWMQQYKAGKVTIEKLKKRLEQARDEVNRIENDQEDYDSQPYFDVDVLNEFFDRIASEEQEQR